MTGEVPQIKGDVQALVESADKNENQKIEDSERELEIENFEITERLRAILKSDDKIKRQALDQAIREVAAQYEGLSSADIYRWIELPAEPERAPDVHRFGRVPEEHPTERHLNELWESMDARERADALREGLRNVEIMRRRQEQLMILVQGVDGRRTMAEKGGNTIGEKIGFWITGKRGTVDREAIQRNANEFLDKVPELQKAIQDNPGSTLRELLDEAGYNRLADYFLRAGILFEDPRDNADLTRDKLSMVRFLRKMGDYQMARTMAQEALAPRFAEAKNRYFKTSMRQVRVGNETFPAEVIPDLYQKSYDRIAFKLAVSIGEYKIKSNPLFDQSKYKDRIREVNQALAYQDYLHYEHERVGEKIDQEDLDKNWSSTEQAIFKQFKDSMGIGALDLADENWDFVIDEVCINAPLIVASGFVGSFAREMARRAVSASARAFLGAARVERIAQVAGRLGRVAAWGGGLAFEAGVFSTTHEALQGRWIGNAPDWAQQWAQSAVFLGTFKGAGQLGKRLAASAKGMVAGIRHPAVLKAAQGFLANGTEFGTEVAAMLALGAAANGAHSRSWEEFAENYEFGQELFRALITAGALKVSGRAAKAAAGRLKGSPPELPLDPSGRLPLRPRRGGPQPRESAREPVKRLEREPAEDRDLHETYLVTSRTSDGREFNPHTVEGTVNGVKIECTWDWKSDSHIVSVFTSEGPKSVILGKSQHHVQRLTRYIAEQARDGLSAEIIAKHLPRLASFTEPLPPKPRPAPEAASAEPPTRPRRPSPPPERTGPPADPALHENFMLTHHLRDGREFNPFLAEGTVNGLKIECTWNEFREIHELVLGEGPARRVVDAGKGRADAQDLTRTAAQWVRSGKPLERILASILLPMSERIVAKDEGRAQREPAPLRPRAPRPEAVPAEVPAFREGFVTPAQRTPEMPSRIYVAEGKINGIRIRCGWEGKTAGAKEGHFLRVEGEIPGGVPGSIEGGGVNLGKDPKFAKQITDKIRQLAEQGKDIEAIVVDLNDFSRLTAQEPSSAASAPETPSTEARTAVQHPRSAPGLTSERRLAASESAPQGPFAKPMFREGAETATDAMRAEFPKMPRLVYKASGFINGVLFHCMWERQGASEGYFLKVGMHERIFLGESAEFAKNVTGRARRMAERNNSPEDIHQTLLPLGQPAPEAPRQSPPPSHRRPAAARPTLPRRPRSSAGGEAQAGF